MSRGVRQLKEEARRAEKREEWGRAIELYRRALRKSEESGDYSLDLSLYNRIGDLHRRAGATDEAVDCYRQAVEQYAEQGLHTGAIALCNKILRMDPGQVEVHRTLGRLHARTGLVAEARRNFRQYAEAMEARDRPEARYDAYAELAQLTGDLDLLLEVADALADRGRESAAADLLLREHRERDGEPPELLRRLRALGEAPPGPDAGQDAPAPPRDAPTPRGEAEEPDAEPEESDAEPAGEVDADPTGGKPEPRGQEPPDARSGDRRFVLSGGPGEGKPPAGEAGAEAPPDSRERQGRKPADDEASDAAERVDLGERIRRRLGSPDGARSRARGADPGPARRDFDDMLLGFRADAEETSGEADPEAHLELGIALRQMGVLDDAIREFQAAARSPEPPLRALELLGSCFLEKGLHGVAVRVLNRALRLPGRSDPELLGVLYQLGVAHQQMGRPDEALDCFERVYSVDIDFRDVEARMQAVRGAAS